MPLLLILFIVVPLIELYLIIQVGQTIGAFWTVALLLADSILGGMLMRSQGRAAWRRFNAAMAEGRPPAREVIDGVLVIFGGAFLLTPGFLTDGIGLLLLFPPTRAAFRGVLLRNFASRLIINAAGWGASRTMRGRADRPRPVGEPRSGRPAAYDVDGTATDVDPAEQRRLP